MQEEIENRSVTLIVNGSKFSGRMLKSAIVKFLSFTSNRVRKHKDVQSHGKMSVKKLIGQNQGVNSLDLTDHESVREFDRFARKYGVDYAIKKVDGEPPKFVLFFKARDADAITSAFTEYTNSWKNKTHENRVSVRKLLRQFKSVVTARSPDRVKDKELIR